VTKAEFATAYNTARMLRDGNVSNVLTLAVLAHCRDVEHVILSSDNLRAAVLPFSVPREVQS
jgi:hypothetical protein